MKFFYCSHCGNLILYAKNKGVPVICCGDYMEELELKKDCDCCENSDIHISSHGGVAIVAIGGNPGHPMTAAHFIEWVALETKEGAQRKELGPFKDSMVTFALTPEDKVVAAYAYCNRCGLIKSD